jgi:hypothetical protein
VSQVFGKREPRPEPPAARGRKGSPVALLFFAVAGIAVAYLIAARGSDPLSKRVPEAKIHSASEPRVALDTIAAPLQTASRPNFPVSTPETLCKARYPMDMERRYTCVRVQNEAKLEAETFRIDDDVKAMCADRYIDDWSMYVTCAKQEMQSQVPDSDKPDRPKFDIGARCIEQWPTNKGMQKYCIKNQEHARTKAQDHYIDNTIAVMCTAEHPADWELFVYCVAIHHGSKLGLAR